VTCRGKKKKKKKKKKRRRATRRLVERSVPILSLLPTVSPQRKTTTKCAWVDQTLASFLRWSDAGGTMCWTGDELGRPAAE
jgi:hypothetical protein